MKKKGEESMKRFRHKEMLSYLLLFILTALFASVFVLRLGIFGGKVDWISQHSVLPDYFRRQFYETGELFPEFALNIGGGQNIYNFAYYGLYSPVVLLSFLFPFVDMSGYMMTAQLLCLGASVMLLYRWLRGRKFSGNISFCMAVVFLLSGPMIYHSYNQIMFVNYMPFLCMGLLGVDRYFDDTKRHQGQAGKYKERKCRCFGMLFVSVFLMIMTSFYFSIGGMLVLILYGLHRYFEVWGWKRGYTGFKNFLAEGVRFSLPFVLAVMLSGVLLVPAAMALAGREGNRADVEIMELLLPQVHMDRFFYTPYGIGLTTFGFTALIAMMFFRKAHERVLGWGCMVVLTVPAFSYALNGGLYIRDKVMIPFLPLFCYVMAYYLRYMEEKNEHRICEMLPYLIPLIFVFLGRQKGDVGKYWELVLFDGAVMLICFLMFQKKSYRKKSSLILLLPVIGFLAVFGVSLHTKAEYAVKREFYRDITDEDAQGLIREVTGDEDGFYRTEQLGTDEENAANLNRIRDMGQYVSSIYSSSYNKEYQTFRRETFRLEEPYRNFLMQPAVYNPIYQDFMGVKYLVSKEKLRGYRAVKSRGKWTVYENVDALPIAYVTDKVMDEKQYDELLFPYNQLALREYAVVAENSSKEEAARAENSFFKNPESQIVSSVRKVDAELPERISSTKNEEFVIDISKEGAALEWDAQKGQRVMFLQFHVKNLKPSRDVSVWAARTRNKLTSVKHFYYNDNTEFCYGIVLHEGQTQVPVTFGKGEYEVWGVKCYVAKLPETDTGLCQTEFKVDKDETKGKVVAGKVEVMKPGYFITSIPYDENFEILIDGKAVEGERVNTAFLGCRIGEGDHEIQIIYHAPGAGVGRLISLAGVIIIVVYTRFCSRCKVCKNAFHLRVKGYMIN